MRRAHIVPLLWILLLVSNTLLAQDWQVPVTVQVDNWATTLYLGCRLGATDAYDNHVDTLAPPPAFGPYAIFSISSFPNYLQADIRAGDAGTVWNLCTFNCSGKQVKIKWDLRSLLAASAGQLQIPGIGLLAAQDSLVRLGDLNLAIEFITASNIGDVQTTVQPASPKLAVFPNPSRGDVTILMQSLDEAQQVFIYNILVNIIITYIYIRVV